MILPKYYYLAAGCVLLGMIIGTSIGVFLGQDSNPQTTGIIMNRTDKPIASTSTPIDRTEAMTTNATNTETSIPPLSTNETQVRDIFTEIDPTPLVTRPEDTPSPTPMPLTPSTPPTPSPTGLTVMAWVYPGEPGCNAGREYRDGRTIDILKPEYFTINSGTLELISADSVSCNGFSEANVADLKRYSRQQFVTVSSASTDAMDTFLAGALASPTDITTLVDFVVEHNLTGIELNFEDFGGWQATSYSNFKEFVKRLGTGLRAEGKQLMVTGPAIADATEQGWFRFRYEDFIGLPVDVMVIMLYDYQYDHGTGEPVAPLDWMERVLTYTKGRLPTSRLSIGIPSYGYEGTIGSRPILRTYYQLKNKPGFASATRDERSAERTWKTGQTVYFYQDSESIRRKIAVVEDAGIRSISLWHLGGNQWF